MDISSSNNFSPKKCWSELLVALKNIYTNFAKSQINPEELMNIIEEEENNTINGVPDVESLENLINEIYTLIGEYKIPGDTSLFLEFQRLAAIYLFSIGSQDKALRMLKDIIKTIDYKISDKNNFDLNLLVIKDCVQLNLAFIHFFLEEFDEAEELITHVVSYYESTDNELYLIKMVNFVSVSFTYLGWIFIKKDKREDAERCFLHALKIVNTVKIHSKEKYKETNFIDTKSKKIFIYDQLINFYTYTEEYENCYHPLEEILKIMDKPSFNYNLDITPCHHLYYYITMILYLLKQTKYPLDFSQILLFFSNIVGIIFKNSEYFDNIHPLLYDKIFLTAEAIRVNHNHVTYNHDTNNDENKYIYEIIDNISQYLDSIIAKFDKEKILSFNPSSTSTSLIDNQITLERFEEYIKDNSFAYFNAMEYLIERHKEINLEKSIQNEIDEIIVIKIACERLLLKYAKIIKDLVDCKNIGNKIIIEGLNGFMIIENDEMVLYCIYRFMARDGNHVLFEETRIHEEEDISEKFKEKETLKVFKVKHLDHKFAPLYYKRITFKLSKDAKTFNFPIYFALINVLLYKKLFKPCVSLISIFLDDIKSILKDLYTNYSQKTECFLTLYEFLLFIQAFILISMKNYERALYELIHVKTCVNETNKFLHKMLIALCLSHNYYFDLAIVYYSEAVNLVKPLIDAYSTSIKPETQGDDTNNNENIQKKPIKTPESFLIEMRTLMSINQCLALATVKMLNYFADRKIKICFRCKKEDTAINFYCLNCKVAIYCNKKCSKKNRIVHDTLCLIYLENGVYIRSTVLKALENYQLYEDQIYRVNDRRKKDNSIL